MVASIDGNLAVTLMPGAELPKYGGIMVMTIPKWYDGATSTVFNVSPKTTCSNSKLLAKEGTPQETNTA